MELFQIMDVSLINSRLKKNKKKEKEEEEELITQICSVKRKKERIVTCV